MNTKKPLSEIVKIVTDTNQYATMYTKEDVLRVLADIDDTSVKITQTQLDGLKRNIRNAIENIDKDNICDGFEFDIRNGNEIEISDFNFDTDSIFDDVWYEVKEFIETLETEE
jgi:hypothetical protein